MSQVEIDVSCNGAIKLGRVVTCDGFVDGYKYRVQTHIHDDHMIHFDRSKGFQTIVMSEETRALLELRHNDLIYRSNVVSLPMNGIYEKDGLQIEFKPSSHMLGAVQVAVMTPEGNRLGYSGDFGWPLEDVIKVGSLVVDSTYGSPESVRSYSQADADEAFREIVAKRIKRGPILIKAHRGTLHRALELLNDLVSCPVIASKKKIEEASVHEKYGYCICKIIDSESTEVREFRKMGRFIELYYIGEQTLYGGANSTVINLTANWVNGSYPYLEISDSTYNIAISDHADFNETLEYVRETEAKIVMTDSTRSNNAADLANAITKRLGIKAFAAHPTFTKAWGV